MDVRRPERLLPVFWRALPHVPQVGRAGGHALLELGREAGQRVLRHPERLEPLVAERHPERHRVVGIERRRRVEIRDQAPQQLAPRAPVVDAHDLVRAGVGGRPGHQSPGLDVVQLQRLGRWGGHGCFGGHDATAPGINALTSTGNGRGSGRRQVGEDVPGQLRRLVDAVADARSLAGVDHQRVVRVHHVVVQRAAAARLVGAPGERRLLDLQVAVGRRRAATRRPPGSRRAAARSGGGRHPGRAASRSCHRGDRRTRGWRSAGRGRRRHTPCSGGRRLPGCRGRGSPDRG